MENSVLPLFFFRNVGIRERVWEESTELRIVHGQQKYKKFVLSLEDEKDLSVFSVCHRIMDMWTRGVIVILDWFGLSSGMSILELAGAGSAGPGEASGNFSQKSPL
ncbi:hypothetical protein BTVI_41655 [Pitangus sulphuratus]|nr:hypothetical protein BTVI_41655 [Pitangus sulphuratus]